MIEKNVFQSESEIGSEAEKTCPEKIEVSRVPRKNF